MKEAISLFHRCYYTIPKYLAEIPIGTDNLMEMARIADFFSHFEEASDKILRECSNVLKLLDNKDLESFSQLYCEQAGDEDLVLHLCALPPAPEPEPEPEMVKEDVEPVKEEKQEEVAVEAAADAAEQVVGPGAGAGAALAAELQMMMAEENQMMMAVEQQIAAEIEILNELYMEHGGGPEPGEQ